MKYFKYVLYAIIALIIIFLAIGMMNPSVSYGHEITVNKSVKEAWAVSQDESKYAQWLEGFIKRAIYAATRDLLFFISGSM